MKSKTTLHDCFKLVICASGTPSKLQREIAEAFPKFAVEHPMWEAVKDGEVIKPKLHLIKAASRNNLPAAIKAVLKKAKRKVLITKMPLHIMINCHGIDEINSIINLDFFKENVGKRFHIMTIFTDKKYENEDGLPKVLKSTIDGQTVKKDTVRDVLSKIDKCEPNDYINDDLPILLFQVDCISEGINLKSFSFIIITTMEERRAHQQGARGMRHYNFKGVEKEDVDIFLFYENEAKISTMFSNLTKFGLTADCFEWSDSIDLSQSSSEEEKVKKLHRLAKYEWEEIDVNNNPVIKQIKLNEKKATDDDIDTTLEMYHKMLYVTHKITDDINKQLVNDYLMNNKWKRDKILQQEFLKKLKELNKK